MTPHSDTDRTLSRRQMLGLGVAGAALGVLAYPYVLPDRTQPGQTMSASQAHAAALAGEIALIDIRRPDEWARTGIPVPAHPIDMRRSDFVAALQAIAGPDRTVAVGVICARGVRSARLTKALADAGFTRIIDIPEGMLGSTAGPGWLANGLPVTHYEAPA